MTTSAPEPVDLAVLTADDALLDALGRGAPAPGGDRTAALLVAWRADLSGGAPDRAVAGDPGRARRHRLRWVRPGIAAAVLVVLFGGLVAGTVTATPHSPLWPLAAAVNPGRADILTADSKLAEARRAIGTGRYADARRLIDEAAAVVARVRDPQQAKRLAIELADARRRLSEAGTGTGPGARPTPTPPAAPQPSGPPAPTPRPSPGNGVPVPGVSLPSGILPTLPLPSLPSLP